MDRFIVRWLIDRAAERDAPLPGWLRRRIARDAELQRFEAASRGLAARLRRDAAPWLALHGDEARGASDHPRLAAPTAHVERSPRSRRSVAQTLAYALAASVLAVALWRALDDANQSPTMSSDEPLANASSVEGISSADRAQLAAAWRSGRSLASSWQAHAQNAVARIEEVDLINPAMIVPRMPSTSAATERLRAALDEAVATQQREFAAGMKSAYRFFAVRLGASVAQLVGLQSG